MKELRRKHEAAQQAVVGAAESEAEAEDQGGEEGTGDDSGAGTGRDDNSGVVAALRKVTLAVPRHPRCLMALVLPFWPDACDVFCAREGTSPNPQKFHGLLLVPIVPTPAFQPFPHRGCFTYVARLSFLGFPADERQAHAEQTAMLEASLAAKAKSAEHALRDRLAAQRCGSQIKENKCWCNGVRQVDISFLLANGA